MKVMNHRIVVLLDDALMESVDQLLDRRRQAASSWLRALAVDAVAAAEERSTPPARERVEA